MKMNVRLLVEKIDQMNLDKPVEMRDNLLMLSFNIILQKCFGKNAKATEELNGKNEKTKFFKFFLSRKRCL